MQIELIKSSDEMRLEEYLIVQKGMNFAAGLGKFG